MGAETHVEANRYICGAATEKKRVSLARSQLPADKIIMATHAQVKCVCSVVDAAIFGGCCCLCAIGAYHVN